MKKLLTKKNILIILVIIAVTILLIQLGGKKTTSAGIEPEEVITETTDVEVISLGLPVEEGESLSFLATVSAQDETSVTAEMSGKVTNVYVEEGDSVQKGQKLFSLRNSDQGIAYQQAQAQLENQRITLRNLEKEFAGEDSSVQATLTDQQTQAVAQAYQNFLNNDLQAYPEDDADREDAVAPVVSGTYRGLEEGRYIIETYGSAADSGVSIRLSGLEDGTYIASTNFPTEIGTQGLYLQFPDKPKKNKTWVIDIPNTRSSSYLSAKNAYEGAKKGKDLTLTQSQVTQEQIDRQRNVVHQQELTVQQAGVALEKTIIRAPFDGDLVAFDVEIGSIVSGFSPVGTIKSLGELELEFSISDQERIYIREGADVYVGDEAIGVVTYVAQSLDGTTYKNKVRASLSNADDFTEGETLTIMITPEVDENTHTPTSVNGVFSLPITAVQIVGNTPHIAVINDDGIVTLQPVATGLLLGSMIEVVEGLSGDEVVIRDARGITNGRQVNY